MCEHESINQSEASCLPCGIEITDEMIEAGLARLYATSRWEYRSPAWDRELIKEILEGALGRIAR